MVSRSWSSRKIFPGRTTAKLLPEVQKFVDDELDIQLQNFEDRIIFMSMYNDIDWTRKDNSNLGAENSSRFSDNARNIAVVNWTYFGPGDGRRKKTLCDGGLRRSEEGKESASMLKAAMRARTRE